MTDCTDDLKQCCGSSYKERLTHSIVCLKSKPRSCLRLAHLTKMIYVKQACKFEWPS